MSESADVRIILDEREIRRLTDQLFILTDRKEWSAAQALFAEGEIEVDMSSLAGGGAVRMTAAQLFAGFAAGLHAKKASHHMTTNYDIEIDGNSATVWAQGYAWNRVAGLEGGSDLWETWGNYRLAFRRSTAGWRITSFGYFAKFNRGNESVRTHSA
ncbi:MAG TPA: nuclear transport factor 2 family protein [Gemmatimonadaceae bacterium]|nr:nuclear transport factor 2 family protein [Gemmatimonadaceae bacterium]